MLRPAYTNMFHLLVSFIILEASQCSTYLEALRNACPFMNFCTEPSLWQYNKTGDHAPCCTECSCEADCWIWDTCCPDVVHEKPADLQKANCIPMNLNQRINDPYFTTKYRVLDFCPGDFVDRKVIDQCEGKFTGTLGVSDVVAVSDVNHGIYKNKYCALCHGVTEFVSWNLKMDGCPWNISLIGTDFLHTIMESCSLQSVPSANTNSDLTLCGNELKDTCPESSLSNPEIIQGCHEVPYIPYLWNGLFSTTLYKNVFCGLCTADQNRPATKGILCHRDWYDSSRGNAGGLSVLIDLTVSKKLVGVPPTTPCTEAEIFDKIQQICIKRFCPSFSIASTGTCVQIGTLMGSLLGIPIVFTPTEPVYISGDIQLHNDKQARKHLLYFSHLINLKGSSCSLRSFHIDLIRDLNTEELLVVSVIFSFLINEKCQLSNVADIVRNELSRYRNVSLTINSVPVRLTGKIDFYRGKDGMTVDNFNNSLYLKNGLTYWQTETFIKETGFYPGFYICPYLVLDIDRYNRIIAEVHAVGGDSNLTEIHRFTHLAENFYALDDGTIALCVDTYFKLYEKNGGQSILTRATLMFTMLIIGMLYD